MLEAPLANIDSYIAFFSENDLPVLRRTVRDLKALHEDEDNVNARRIAAVVLQDPLMAMRLLTYLEANRRKSQNHDITTIDRAIMMIGITPFFQKFSNLATAEDTLAKHPRALVGVLKVISRAKSASNYAREWALIRHDLNVEEVTVATLLHDAAEILFWCFAPTLMQRVAQVMQNANGVRSAVAQSAVLNVAMTDIQLALVRAWGLPELLVTLMSEDLENNHRARNVILANDLARHAANGWNDPALVDDYRAIAALLHLSPETTLQRLGVPEEHWPSSLTTPLQH